ncbi:hypothetical protein [Halobacteriovorax sp. JY17]|uniref:hypothetical protein n=1 Tax=Halobacteriovorax sp. JY17 TaxID=2014617 RepID=UPI000C3D8BA4|nr:hypothetical protein [Halobacteriovorax sp. JY17]PIK15101.1 MAG: hypothetical protein CES88_12265 [Halobacteriovorax sp. JY17]
MSNIMKNGIGRKGFLVGSLCTWGGGVILSFTYFSFFWMKPNYRLLRSVIGPRNLTDKMALEWAFGAGLYIKNEEIYSVAVSLLYTLSVILIASFSVYQFLCYLRLKNMSPTSTVNKKSFFGELAFRIFTLYISRNVFIIYMSLSFLFLVFVDKKEETKEN